MILCRRLTLVVALLFLYMGIVVAQTRVSGIVISAEDNEPLIGAIVTVDGSKTRTVTDVDGKFNISVPNTNSVVVFSMVGMRSKKSGQADARSRCNRYPTDG